MSRRHLGTVTFVLFALLEWHSVARAQMQEHAAQLSDGCNTALIAHGH